LGFLPYHVPSRQQKPSFHSWCTHGPILTFLVSWKEYTWEFSKSKLCWPDSTRSRMHTFSGINPSARKSAPGGRMHIPAREMDGADPPPETIKSKGKLSPPTCTVPCKVANQTSSLLLLHPEPPWPLLSLLRPLYCHLRLTPTPAAAAAASPPPQCLTPRFAHHPPPCHPHPWHSNWLALVIPHHHWLRLQLLGPSMWRLGVVARWCHE
jgi:hypothetical protein